MRISDWSSDVRSSDLGLEGRLRAFLRQRRKHHHWHWLALHQLFQKLQTALARHFEVQRQHVGLQLRDHVPCFSSIRRCTHYGAAAGTLKHVGTERSEERSVGKAWVSTSRYRWYANP